MTPQLPPDGIASIQQQAELVVDTLEVHDDGIVYGHVTSEVYMTPEGPRRAMSTVTVRSHTEMTQYIVLPFIEDVDAEIPVYEEEETIYSSAPEATSNCRERVRQLADDRAHENR